MKPVKPCPKHDLILHRDLTTPERLDPAVTVIKFMRSELDDLEYRIKNASDSLTEDQLLTICDAVSNAYHAVCNASRLGESGYHALPVRVIRWDHEGVEK